MAQYILFTPCVGSSGSSFVADYDATFWSNTGVPAGLAVSFTNTQTGSCFTVSQFTANYIPPATPPDYDPSIDLSVLTFGVDYIVFGDCDSCIANFVDISGYQLVNCDNPANTICINNPSSEIPLTSIVKYEGECWYIEYVGHCDSSTYIDFSSLYVDCEACKDSLPKTNYQLIDCVTEEFVVYTSSDLAEFAGQVVQLNEYPDQCFSVIVLGTDIPSDIPVTVTSSFANCVLCASDYYELTPCIDDGSIEPIVTITDLSLYVGQVITIASCPDICWQVATSSPVPNPQEVEFLASYIDCADCTTTVLPAICVTFTNTSDDATSFNYTDYLGVRNKVTVAGKTVIEKVCAIAWDINPDVSVTQFGNCVDGECPVAPTPKRAVTPGYNTPACSTDYYEKVECAFSEVMYKEVLSERYGISNCCPENDMKWVIKHEMLMLDILVNPDYTCTPVSTCACPVIGGTTLNTACPDTTQYFITRCDGLGATEVVRIDNQYDVLGKVIIINDICYEVVEPTNRLVTVYWTPGTIYDDCQACPTP